MILRGERKLRLLTRDLLVIGCDAHELQVITSMTYLTDEYIHWNANEATSTTRPPPDKVGEILLKCGIGAQRVAFVAKSVSFNVFYIYA